MNRKWIHIITLLFVAISTSCTKVGFEHDQDVESTLSTSTRINLEYDWSAIESHPSFHKPDSMYVALSRLVDEKHYLYLTDTLGQIIEENIVGVEINRDTMKSVVDNGAYYIMAFNYNESEVTMNGLESFSMDNSASLGSIFVSIPRMSPEEKAVLYPDLSADYNSSLDYIKSISEIYFDAYKDSFTPEDSIGVITVRPKPLTQKIIFNFEFALEGEVELDKALGVLSGVTESIELMSQTIQDTAVFQTVFDLGLSKEPIRSEEKDGKIYDVYIMSGEVNTFGVIPSETSLDRRGPGILNLTIKAKLGDKSHSYHLGVNLYDFIMGEGLIEYKADGTGHTLKIKDTPSNYHFGATMYLNEDFLLQCTDVGGAEIWEYDEDNDFEIEI